MAFHEVQFPTGIAYGATGGPAFRTSIIQMDSGAEERVARWEQPLYRYDVSKGIKDLSDIQAVLEFFIARQGATAGFRFKDWTDYSSDPTHDQAGSTPDDEDVEIGTGDGATTDFQLIKKYTSGAVTRTRNITKPVSGTVVVAVDGVAQTESTDFTVNTTTGVVTFDAGSIPTAGQSITAGYDFDVPVRFGQAVDEDGLRARIDAFNAASIGAIELVEIRDSTPAPGEFFYGGTHEIISLDADTTMSVSLGRVVRVAACNGTAKLILPNTSGLEPGGPYFYIVNLDNTNTITVEDEDANTVATVGTESTTTILLAAQDDTLPSQTFYMSDTDDGISSHVLDGGAGTTKFMNLCYQAEQTSGTATIGSVGAFQSDNGYFTSEAGVPGILNWQSGTHTFEWEISVTNAVMQGQSRVWRVSSDAQTLIDSSSPSTLFGIPTIGSYTDTVPTKTWNSAGGESSTDRLVFQFIARNNSGGLSPTVTLDVGSASETRVVSPIIDQPTLYKWIGF